MIETAALTFAYGDRPVLVDVSLYIGAGERCLLVGRNGAGKSTLLALLAGQHLLPRGIASVLGRDAFHDTSLARDVVYVGPLLVGAVDITVDEMLLARRDHDRARAARLCELLEVDRAWHLYRLSAGQRRRVQLLMAFLQPARVYLLDEVSAELDLLSRANLLSFLREETEKTKATVIYATHIIEGLESWATRILWIDQGRIARDAPLLTLREYVQRQGEPSALLRVVEGWFRETK